MSTVAFPSSLPALAESVTRLRESVVELVLVVESDRPLGPGADEPAVVEDLADTVLDIQSDVVRAGTALTAAHDLPSTLEQLPTVDRALREAGRRYWRGVRAHRVVHDLRAGTTGRGAEWRSWRCSVEESAARCEATFHAVDGAAAATWAELAAAAALTLRASTTAPSVAGAPPDEPRGGSRE